LKKNGYTTSDNINGNTPFKISFSKKTLFEKQKENPINYISVRYSQENRPLNQVEIYSNHIKIYINNDTNNKSLTIQEATNKILRIIKQ